MPINYHRVDLDEAHHLFDHQGVPGADGVTAEFESRAADGFTVLESLAGTGGGGGRHVRKIAARILELTRTRDAEGLVTTLDTNLFQLLHGDTSRWSERKRTKHRVRLNRFREAFIRALGKVRRQQRGEST